MEPSYKDILEKYPEYEATIGIEVHVQLKTNSKIFCSCPNQFGDNPNSNICPVCSGYPGTLPVLNKKVVDFAIMTGLATNCEISKVSEFSRKHYRYPDLPKNYQITQADKPICLNGYIPIDLEDPEDIAKGSLAKTSVKQKRIRLMRIHMEEDAGKNIHATDDESFVDLNRAGTPLLEIVTHPDIANAYEARAYLTRLHAIVKCLGVSEANMEEGSFRADINISVKKKTDTKLGTRVEMKNINSFKFISKAINHEIERHIDVLENGGKITQETRLWDDKKQETVFMRSKEEAQDYRYFTEPDLPLLVIDSAWIERIKQIIPELPHQKAARLINEYQISAYEAEILVSKSEIADFFEAAVKLCKKPKQVSNWMLRNLLGYLNDRKISLAECKVTPKTLAELVETIEQGIITSKIAQEVFVDMAQTGKYPSVIINEKNLGQIGSTEELERIVLEVLQNNPSSVEDYKKGNQRTFSFLIGQALKATQGKGNPSIIQELLKKHLK